MASLRGAILGLQEQSTAVRRLTRLIAEQAELDTLHLEPFTRLLVRDTPTPRSGG